MQRLTIAVVAALAVALAVVQELEIAIRVVEILGGGAVRTRVYLFLEVLELGLGVW